MRGIPGNPTPGGQANPFEVSHPFYPWLLAQRQAAAAAAFHPFAGELLFQLILCNLLG